MTDIEIHGGFTVENSIGCVLVGEDGLGTTVKDGVVAPFIGQAFTVDTVINGWKHQAVDDIMSLYFSANAVVGGSKSNQVLPVNVIIKDKDK